MKRLLLLMLLIATSAVSRAQISYFYHFRNNLHEATTGPSLTATCADSFVTDLIPDYSLTRPVYHFGSNCGVNYNDAATNALIIGDYTIEMYVALDSIESYRKLIDYKNMSDDGGLYVNDSSLDFFSIKNTNTTLYRDGKYMFTTITRNNANQAVKLFVNGQYLDSFVDAAADAYYNVDKLLRFFQNDTLNVTTEASAGKVAYLAIYNYVRDPQLVHNDYLGLGNILATNVPNVNVQNELKIGPNPATDVLQVTSVTELNLYRY